MTTLDAGLNTYTELADTLQRLPDLLRDARRARRLSLRAAAEQIGCSSATIHRLEHGDDCALSSAVAIVRWLDQTASSKPPPDTTWIETTDA